MNIINAEKSLKYLNYGSVGFIIARELCHIFDEFVSLLSERVCKRRKWRLREFFNRSVFALLPFYEKKIAK
jgi:hypothetical protein